MAERAEVVLAGEEREVLERWARRPTSAQQLAFCCRIVLASAQGRSSTEIAAELGCIANTVGSGGAGLRGAGLTGCMHVVLDNSSDDQVDQKVDQTRRSPLSPRPLRLDPHLDHQLERRPQALSSGTRPQTRTSTASPPTASESTTQVTSEMVRAGMTAGYYGTVGPRAQRSSRRPDTGLLSWAGEWFRRRSPLTRLGARGTWR
jgi:hypothetical protein